MDIPAPGRCVARSRMPVNGEVVGGPRGAEASCVALAEGGIWGGDGGGMLRAAKEGGGGGGGGGCSM